MKKNTFTLIELLVVITIIAILASMLFPTFGKMQRKARQTQSMNSAKQHASEVIGFFTDPRKHIYPMPNLVSSGLYTANHFSDDLDLRERTWDTNAGEIAFGYPTYFWMGPNSPDTPSSNSKFSVYDPEVRLLNGINGSNTGALRASTTGGGGRLPSTSTAVKPYWRNMNNSESVIMTSLKHWTLTAGMKPLAFGDGHASVSGTE